MWVDTEPFMDVTSFQIVLGLAWAEELWAWALDQEFAMSPRSCSTYARILETYKKHQKVDDMIDNAVFCG